SEEIAIEGERESERVRSFVLREGVQEAERASRIDLKDRSQVGRAAGGGRAVQSSGCRPNETVRRGAVASREGMDDVLVAEDVVADDGAEPVCSALSSSVKRSVGSLEEGSSGANGSGLEGVDRLEIGSVRSQPEDASESGAPIDESEGVG